MLIKRWLMATACLIFSVAAHASDQALLDSIFQYTTLKADFTQEVLDQKRIVQQVMKGKVFVQRPGRFRWNYQSPYEQEIVADGDKVWMYDVDLEQVTVKAQKQAMSGTPAIILTEYGRVTDQFEVRNAERHDDMHWFELVPKKADGSFERLFLGVENKQLKRLEIEDSFGQITLLYFDNLHIDQSIPADTFEFIVPQEVDVIDETASF